MNNLPKVSAFEIKKKLDNSQERFYSAENKIEKFSPGSVVSKINSIFASNNHVYKSKVRIKLKDDLVEKIIVGKTAKELLTLSGEKIDIASIVDIERM